MPLECPDCGNFHFFFESNGNRKRNASKDDRALLAQILLKDALAPAKAWAK
jgi:hypothetical protein